MCCRLFSIHISIDKIVLMAWRSNFIWKSVCKVNDRRWCCQLSRAASFLIYSFFFIIFWVGHLATYYSSFRQDEINFSAIKKEKHWAKQLLYISINWQLVARMWLHWYESKSSSHARTHIDRSIDTQTCSRTRAFNCERMKHYQWSSMAFCQP